MINPNRRKPDILPVIVLIAIVAAAGLCIFLFPYAASFLDRQNCVASGRTDCG